MKTEEKVPVMMPMMSVTEMSLTASVVMIASVIVPYLYSELRGGRRQ